jgi:hypothetical protein
MLVPDWRWATETHSLSIRKLSDLREKVWGSWQRTSCDSESTARLKTLPCRYWEAIQIYTDHKNLRNFATTKQLNQQQVRWAKQLADYKFKSITRRGMRMMKQTLWVDSLTMKSEKDSRRNSEWRQEILTKA